MTHFSTPMSSTILRASFVLPLSVIRAWKERKTLQRYCSFCCLPRNFWAWFPIRTDSDRFEPILRKLFGYVAENHYICSVLSRDFTNTNTKNMKKEFVSKRDLGMAYFPNLEPMSARHKLCSLIHGDSTLFRRLTQMGYRKSSKCFSPNQLEAIFERLGMPWWAVGCFLGCLFGWIFLRTQYCVIHLVKCQKCPQGVFSF